MRRLSTVLLALIPPLLVVAVTTQSWSPQFAAAQPPAGFQRGGDAGPRQDPLLELLDANGDGELTGAEIQQAPAALNRLDRNGDGQLTEDELIRRVRGFGPSPPGGPGGPGGGGGRQRTMLVDRFDEDKDGRLSRQEREVARRFVKENNTAGARGGPGRRGGRGRGGPGGIGPALETGPGPKISPSDVTNHPHGQLYDESILRTIFLEFEHDDWEQELADFYRTDVEVPVTLSVDGKKYKNVGAKFRGNSSFFAVQEGQKRSFNLTLDFVDRDQNLYGYRTLNLLNAHSDPSFLRTVLYNHIAREYTPAPKANFVKVVVNGESWGVYINAQQFNKEFSEEWFDERGGARWKVPAGGGGGRSLNYNGDDPAAYASYELKSKSSKQVRSDLIELCRVLNEIPIDQLDTKLDSVLNVDRVLWFLALDNALIDSDGYYTRGSDYLIYQDQQFGRFHVLPYDSNEVFRLPSAGRGRGGPGGPGGRGGPPGFGGRPGFGRPPGFGGPPGVGEGRQDRPIRPGGEDGGPGDRGTRPQQGEAQRPPRDAGAAPVGFALSPFAGEEREEFPLINRLLANPRIRARYVAHVRTIANRWLDWKLIGPIIEDYRALIDKEIDADTRKLSSYADFAASLEQAQVGSRRPAPGLKTFVEARRDYLINHPDLKRPAPRIHSVNHRVVGEPEASGVTARDSVRVQAMVSDELLANEVLLYFATARNAPFTVRPMTDDGIHLDNRVFHAVIPAQLAGSHIFYYVEARSTAQGTSSFEPESSELHALNYRVAAPVATASAIVINEVLASNSRSARDAQGEFEDWIELYNTSDKAVVLSNMYLSDKDDNPRKWAFPTGTTIAPGGYLIVWADEDGGAKEGLHANFKLSQSGETVRLVDTDDRANAILDSVTFDKQKTDVSMGRYPNGSGSLRPMKPSPNQKNESGTE